MILDHIINRLFIGISNIPDKFLRIEKNDYLYLTLNNVRNNTFVGASDNKYISYKKLRSLDIVKYTLEYGDFLIYKQDDQFRILRYANDIGNKVIVSDDFIVLRTVGGGYFKNFISDVNGRVYFLDKVISLQKAQNDDNFVKMIPSIDIPLLSDLNPDKKEMISTTVKELPLDPSKIDVRTERIAISTIVKRIEREAIDMFTDFQRLQNLWDNDVKSRFIESLLVRFPVPSFYFDCSNAEKWLVIDGLQRLSTLKQFVVDKSLKLEGMEFLTNLNGKYYDKLSIREKSIIEETNITTIQIHASTPARVKYSLFERINKDGKPLTSQELRHAINSINGGKPSNYVKKLANEPFFKEIWGSRKKDRMQDREMVLSYIAFRITNYKEYKYSEKKSFLDESMSKIYQKSEITLDEWLYDFRKALMVIKEVFEGTSVFYREVKSGNAIKQRFSPHLFEILSYGFSVISDSDRSKLIKERNVVQELFKDILTKDDDFIESISNEQYSITSINVRFNRIVELINLIIDDK